MQTILYVTAVALGLLAAEGSAHDVFSRWRRQATACQPGDEACQKCSSNCGAVTTSHLPECCEAFNACCDEYFQACKKCSNIVSKDQYFPEYCCASFTACCDLITTFTAQVKPPAPVRPKPKAALKIPEVTAPRPTVFPGANPVTQTNKDSKPPRPNVFQDAEFSPVPAFASQGPPPQPQESIFAPQRPIPAFPQEPAFDPRSPEPVPREPAFAPRTPAASRKPAPSAGGGDVSEDNSQRQRTRTQARAQARPQNRGRQENTRRNNNNKKNDVDLAARRGRVTSRGRVSA